MWARRAPPWRLPVRWAVADSNHRSSRTWFTARPNCPLWHLPVPCSPALNATRRSRRWDSNPQPAVYKTAALPIELRRHAWRLIRPTPPVSIGIAARECQATSGPLFRLLSGTSRGGTYGWQLLDHRRMSSSLAAASWEPASPGISRDAVPVACRCWSAEQSPRAQAARPERSFASTTRTDPRRCSPTSAIGSSPTGPRGRRRLRFRAGGDRRHRRHRSRLRGQSERFCIGTSPYRTAWESIPGSSHPTS